MSYIDLGSGERCLYIAENASTCVLYICLFYLIQIKDYNNNRGSLQRHWNKYTHILIAHSSHAEDCWEQTLLWGFQPHTGSPCQHRGSGQVPPAPLVGFFAGPWVAGEGFCLVVLPSSFPASRCLLLAPAEEQLKAQLGCAHWERMETRWLSFMEIILRGPRLAAGVWVPVVLGWAAGWFWVESGQLSFLQPPGSLYAVPPPVLGQLRSHWGSGL